MSYIGRIQPKAIMKSKDASLNIREHTNSLPLVTFDGLANLSDINSINSRKPTNLRTVMTVNFSTKKQTNVFIYKFSYHL